MESSDILTSQNFTSCPQEIIEIPGLNMVENNPFMLPGVVFSPPGII